MLNRGRIGTIDSGPLGGGIEPHARSARYPKTLTMQGHPLFRKAPPPYGTIAFDCDSTLSAIEGIEALAAAAGREAEVRAWTEEAMAGSVPLEDVYGRRLELIRPSHAAVVALGERYVETLVPGARELVAALLALEKRVCVVSGGLLEPVRALARELAIPSEDVFAVELRFGSGGAYAGFDARQPLARSRGKLEVLRSLAEGPRARPPLALVGDGATDLEASPASSRFIAFGGVARHEAVLAAADERCEAADLAALLPLLCASSEIERLAREPRHEALVARARELAPEGDLL